MIALPSYSLLKLKQALKYNNTSNLLDIPSKNNKKKLESANIDKQKAATLLGFIPQNKLLSELSSTF